jgi:hypothetical protein
MSEARSLLEKRLSNSKTDQSAALQRQKKKFQVREGALVGQMLIGTEPPSLLSLQDEIESLKSKLESTEGSNRREEELAKELESTRNALAVAQEKNAILM